ncbi:hypothetical protein [Providencia rettgeri]|nr:hypothetical protein [Providencia rettgeri]
MNKLNPIVVTMKRDDVDTLIDVLLSAMDIDINTDDRAAFKTIY